MLLSDFHPHPTLVTRASSVARPRFPVIDAHNHLGELFGGGWDQRPPRELLDVLDEANVPALVDLDGGWGQALLEKHLDLYKAAAPERFRIFGGVDWEAWPEHGDRFGEWAAGSTAGAKGTRGRGAQDLEAVRAERARPARDAGGGG